MHGPPGLNGQLLREKGSRVNGTTNTLAEGVLKRHNRSVHASETRFFGKIRGELDRDSRIVDRLSLLDVCVDVLEVTY